MAPVRWMVAIASLLLLAAPAWAAEGTLEGAASLPIEADNATATATDGMVFLGLQTDASVNQPGDRGSLEIQIDGEAGKIFLYTHRAFGYVHPDDPSVEILWTPETERKAIDLAGTEIELLERRSQFQLLAHNAEVSMEDTASSPLLVGLTTEDRLHSADVRDATKLHLFSGKGNDYAPYTRTVPAGMLHARSESGLVELDGSFTMFLGESILAIHREGHSELIKAHFRQEEKPGRVYDPVENRWFGPGTHTEYIQQYIVVEAKSAHATIAHTDIPASIYATATQLSVEGKATLYDMKGRVTVHDEEETIVHKLNGEDLSLGGHFTFTANDLDTASQRVKVDGSGDFTQVTYGPVAAEYDWAKAITTVTIGALLLAGLAWLGKALGGGAIAGYARVQGPKVLEHSGRQEVYDRIKQNPGIGFSQLVKTLPFGDSTLQYHLRVLERNDFVTQVKDGRYLRFFDRQSGLYSADRKVAVSALRNDTTARIANAILTQPGIAQRDLAMRFGIAASTVNWHIQRLSRAGLVDRRRDHPHTRYYAGDAWSSIPQDEHARVMHAS